MRGDLHMTKDNLYNGEVPLIFAGDIGGTHTRLAILSFVEDKFRILNQEGFATKDWNDLGDLLNSYFSNLGLRTEDINAGCLCLAGPVNQTSSLLTNSKHLIDFDSVRRASPFQSPLLFVNDLEGMGWGISLLKPDDLLCLTPGTSLGIQGHKALIAPGTGLGEAMISSDGRVYSSEGGHGDFAPHSEKELDLWRYLTGKYGHVSYERVLSGEGLENIYEFISLKVHGQNPVKIVPTPEITKKALNGVCSLCIETLELFVSILGAEAGNLALRTLARGGVYLGGGIPRQIIPKLQDSSFRDSFCAKGRFQEFLAQIPIYVILNDNAPLLGAAQIAMDRYSSGLGFSLTR